MDFKHFSAGKDDDGRRLDKILRRFLDENALSSIYKSLRKGLIKVNGKKCDGNFRISEKDDISIADFLLIASENENIDEKEKYEKIDDKIVLFKNEHLLILNKPYDIPVQPSKDFSGKVLSEIVESDYNFHHPNKNSISFRTGPLHRLDRKTTGVIVFSQSLEGARIFSEFMQTHKIQKTYIGILSGHLKEKALWIDRIEKSKSDEKNANFHKVQISDDKGKESYTEVTPLAYGISENQEVTVAEFLIKTGRTHQIRAQSAEHGFPLLGDTAYGARKIKNSSRDFFLHAIKMEFKEKQDFFPERIDAPLKKDFRDFLKTLDVLDKLKF